MGLAFVAFHTLVKIYLDDLIGVTISILVGFINNTHAAVVLLANCCLDDWLSSRQYCGYGCYVSWLWPGTHCCVGRLRSTNYSFRCLDRAEPIVVLPFSCNFLYVSSWFPLPAADFSVESRKS